MDRDRSRLMGGWEHLYAEWDRVGSRLMSGVCHYFNDRLMVVLGTIDLREGLDGELNEDLRVIRGEMDRIQRAVGSLSALFREPGGPREPVWLGDLAEEIVRAYGYRRDRGRVRVEARGDPYMGSVTVDPPLIYRASLLLLEWAGSRVEGAPGGETTISYGQDGSAPALWIEARAGSADHHPADRPADSGPGSGAAPSWPENWPATFSALQQRLADAGVELAMSDPCPTDTGLVRFTLRFPEGASDPR